MSGPACVGKEIDAMKLLRVLLLTCLAVSGAGCISIRIPEPPDVHIHGEVEGDRAEGEVESSPK